MGSAPAWLSMRPRRDAHHSVAASVIWASWTATGVTCFDAAWVPAKFLRARGRPSMPQSASPINYRLGSLYSVITAFLYATQEPFSFPAARHLRHPPVCVPDPDRAARLHSPVDGPPASRRDFVALLRKPANYGYLAVIFAIGMSGLLLYNLGLSNAHPIIISAILNLSPFWAALVALVISRVADPDFAGDLFRLLRRRLHRRDGGRLEPAWRRRQADFRRIGRQFRPRKLGLRHSRPALFRPGRNASRQSGSGNTTNQPRSRPISCSRTSS